jgi:hypothetical protein
MTNKSYNQCVHLSDYAWDRANEYAKSKGMFIRSFIEKIILDASNMINCKNCSNPYCTMAGIERYKKSCGTYEVKK